MDIPTTAHHTRPARGLLPAAPDLVVSRRPGEPASVDQIAPWLAARMGKEPRDLFGQPVETLDRVIPGLTELVAAAFDNRGPVVSGQLAELQAGAVPAASLIATPVERVDGETSRAVSVQIVSTAEETGLRATHAFSGLIGHGAAMRALFAQIDRYAASSAPVLITGESGTGKELVARALHQRSPRRAAPFVAVNLAALSSGLIESELFGHEKGAFTGATSSHRGRFERAHGGTLFLDEIGDMPRRSQTKLLRVLEEGAVEPVGAERSKPVDVRVVAATNVPLEQQVAARRFRDDLYYRLSVLRLHLPPLRERGEDILLLATYFLSVFAHQYGRRLLRLTPGALHLLTSYGWPGNVRELKNVLERIVVESAGDVIGERAFAEWVRERERLAPGAWDLEASRRARVSVTPIITPYPAASPRALAAPTIDATYTESPAEAERRSPPPRLTREAVLAALAASGGNVTQAARQLGLHKATLYRRLREWGVHRKDFPAPS
jgi:DNA-binding NtrC family response regulator